MKKYILLVFALLIIPFISSAQTPTLTVLYPNGGETLVRNQTTTLRWSSSGISFPAQLQINFNQISGSNQRFGYSISIPNAPANFNSYTLNLHGSTPRFLSPGTYRLNISYWKNGQLIVRDTSDALFSIVDSLPVPPIILSSPNGGEVWQLQRTHSILWSPYNTGWRFDDATNTWIYDPRIVVNPASTTSAYLEKLVNGNFITVGRILELRGASIHWSGPLVGEFQIPVLTQPDSQYPPFYTYDPPPFYPPDGQYYIRVVNNATRSWDRSDNPFTLAPENSIWADLKINGGGNWNNPILVLPIASTTARYLASWTSNSQEKCSLYYNFNRIESIEGAIFDSNDFTYGFIPDLPANGSMDISNKVFPFTNTESGASGVVFIDCPTSIAGSGIEGGDWAGVLFYYDHIPESSTSSVASVNNFTPNVKVLSPNTREIISWSDPRQITWTASPDVESVSIALYKNSAFYRWIARDLPSQIKNYRWTPSSTIPSSEFGGNFQIDVIGQKKNYHGIIADKSDLPFTLIMRSLTPQPTPTSVSAPTPIPLPIPFPPTAIPTPTITSSYPPNGAIVAQDTSTDWFKGLSLYMSSGNVPNDFPASVFSVSSSRTTSPITITNVQYGGGVVIYPILSRSLSAGERIRLTHKPSGSSVCLGFLPGDVNGDGRVQAYDISLLNSWLGTPEGLAKPLYQTDINRDGVFNQADITKLGEISNSLTNIATRTLPACPGSIGMTASQSQLATTLASLGALLQILQQSFR